MQIQEKASNSRQRLAFTIFPQHLNKLIEFCFFMAPTPELKHETGIYPAMQVIYDARQVTSPGQIAVGGHYTEMHVNNPSDEPVSGLALMVTKIHKPKKNWFTASAGGKEHEISMADRGVISYGTVWNNANFLMPVDSKGKSVELSRDKVHPHSLYVEAEYVDGACDDRSFAWFYYGPFNNRHEIKKVMPLLEHRHRHRDNRCYTMMHVFNGEWFMKWKRGNKVVSPEDFLANFQIDEASKVHSLEDCLKTAKADRN